MDSSVQSVPSLSDNTGSASRDSKAPLLPASSDPQNVGLSGESGSDKEGKPRKRDFFRFGKKGEDEKKTLARSSIISPSPVTTAPRLSGAAGMRPVSPLASASSLRATGSPPHTHPYSSPTSPGRQRLQSASPRAHSPSTSQIFERNVQEDVVPSQASPQIPSHIITENHIPPALDASSEAITNSKLDPDTVEIVTHANHQPAAATIPGATDISVAPSVHEEIPHHVSRLDADNASNYGSLDIGDVRRLSFISFADVVHAEHELEEQRRDSTGIQALSGHPALGTPRSPSPNRFAERPQPANMSPSIGAAASLKGKDMSPSRGVRGTGSPVPVAASPFGASELNIETMRQALRKTGSGDLTMYRSGSTGAVGADT